MHVLIGLLFVKRAIALDRRVCELETENAMLRNLRALKIPRGASGALGEEGRFLEKELSEDTKRFLVDELSPSRSGRRPFSLS